MADIKKRDVYATSIQRYLKLSNRIADDVSREWLTTHIHRLDDVFAKYEASQSKVDITCGNKEELDFQCIERDKNDEYYCTALVNFQTALNNLPEAETSNGNQQENQRENQHRRDDAIVNIKLPSISLPQFCGKYEEWKSFENLFKSMIHRNTSLSNCQKLHYLKSNVCGEAADLIKSFQITDANYTIAWETLVNRFNNNRFIIDAHLKNIFNISQLQFESHLGLKLLRDKFQETVRSLAALDQPTQHWDTILIFLLVSKLDKDTHRQWELTLNRNEMPTFAQLIEFIDARWQCLEMVLPLNMEVNKNPKPKSVKSIHHAAITELKCVCCGKNHRLYQCDKFLNLSYDDKIDFIRSNNLCFNCLKVGHSSSRCFSWGCRKCKKKHNTILHKSSSADTTTGETSSNASNYVEREMSHTTTTSNLSSGNIATNSNLPDISNSSSTLSSHLAANSYSQVLLSTAQVITETGNKHYTLRALIDSGSQASFITKHMATKLKLKQIRTNTTINGVGSSMAGNTTTRVRLYITSRINNGYKIPVDAYILETITSQLPVQTFDINQIHHLKDIHLADPEFNKPGNIDVLFGADVYSKVILTGLKKGNIGTPVAQETELGWIIFGNVATNNNESLCSNSFHLTTEPIESTLKKFWEVEEIFNSQPLSFDEAECEDIFEKTYSQSNTGRFIVHLPFKSTSKKLGESRTAAVRRLEQMERRFIRNPELKMQYTKFMEEYLQLEHMEKIAKSEIVKPVESVFYLPHHSVQNPDSTTTKLRVVFDGSISTSSGTSINDMLLVGPPLQNDLFSILIRWKKHQIVLIADIEKMYRQVLIHKPHTDFQRIVWRRSTEDEIEDYRLLTVTYGMASASHSAIKSLRQLATNSKDKYPIGADIILNDFYVDDLISGTNDIKTAVEIYHQLTSLLLEGGFNLRKWNSNNQELLSHIPDDHRGTTSTTPINMDILVKTLGIHWCPVQDAFKFKINHPSESIINPTTKRMLLSGVAKLFDPLGWLAPVIIRAKIMLQSLWLSGITWDDYIPAALEQQWLLFKSELMLLNSLSLQRWIGFSSQSSQIQLHGFSDASGAAYSAVVYSRVDNGQDVTISILAAKTKVAPIKTISIPRLELCGAVLVSKLLEKCSVALNISDSETFAWTDSTIVLSWIHKLPNSWKTFVANRVTDIQNRTNPSNWNHVPTDQNPADCASRGINASELINHPLWWTGPTWLRLHQATWPKCNIIDTSVEMRSKSVQSLTIIISKLPLELIEQYSSLQKIITITALCYRFIRNCRLQLSKRSTEPFITVPERRQALQILITAVQQEAFSDEISRCRSGDTLLSKSRIISLNPFIDESGILRVGGRIQAANISYSQTHPIILPKRNNLTNVIISEAHSTTLHGGAQLMMAHLNRQYWIIGLRDLVRTHIRHCTVCIRHRANTQQQLMGNLPSVRITPSRAFLHSGVDYAGPIALKFAPGRGAKSIKGYIAVFVCLVTKAIHLEIVGDLTSNGFIAAYRRFISRRGKCSDLYSDCGTNFVGANRILTSMQHKAISENRELAKKLASEGTTWHFIPPSSPHFGGLWEAGVKSTKTHLKKAAGHKLLTFEEMATLLSQIEACLNSRPLCPVSNSIDDISILTPGHFLIGEALISVPESSLLDLNPNRLSHWQQIQQQLQQFWHSWSSEYLTRLQQRPKWLQRKTNIEEGQLVIIKDDRMPPASWSLGRIIQLHPGNDGLVRVATVRRNGVNGKLPITKLCLLPSYVEDTSTAAVC